MFNLIGNDKDFIIDGIPPKEVYQQLIDYDNEFEKLLAMFVEDSREILYVNAKVIVNINSTEDNSNAILKCIDGSIITYPLIGTGYDTLISELSLRKGDIITFDEDV